MTDAAPSGSQHDRLHGFATDLAAAHSRLRGRLADLRAAVLAGHAPDAAGDLRDRCLAFCGTVRTHHVAEDGGLFAALVADRPDLAPRVHKLLEDHAMVAGILTRVEEVAGAAGPRDVLLGELDGLTAILTSHFAFEERVVAGWAGPPPRTAWTGDVLHPDAVPRPTVRVLLLDGAGRVLLFQGFTETGQPFWFPAGGGVEPGETPDEAAVRELTEETGWARPVLGPHIGDRRHVVGWDGTVWDVRERWYLARVDSLEVDTSGYTEAEVAADQQWRWWSPADLAASPDLLVPADLADVVASVLRDGPPRVPLTLGI